jgi:hypothetical protein
VVDGGGAGGAGAPASAPRLGAPVAVVVVALLPAPPRPPRVAATGDFRMQEVVAVAPNHSYFVLLRVIRCSLWACGLRRSLKCPLRAM